MTDLTLFIDQYEAGFPSTVRELLNDTEKRKTHICAAITPVGKSLLICNNHIYIWSYIATERETEIPNATHMELPPTGLNYSNRLVYLFNKASQPKNLSLLAISPEGHLRYWAELGKQAKNEHCLLNNEVAHSIQLIDSQEHVHRFLLTTTTGSFHIIDLFHGLNQPDRLATRPLDVGGPTGGIGHRMSLLLFGSLTAEKEQILKTLFFPSAIVINVLPRYLRFYTIIDQKSHSYEVDIADMALNKYNKISERPERRHFRIVDATQYRNGILLFLVAEKESGDANERRFHIDRRIFLAYYEDSNLKKIIASSQRHLQTLIPLELPESLKVTGLEKRLNSAQLMCSGNEECYIAFYDAFILVRHPDNLKNISTLIHENYTTENFNRKISPNKRNDGDTLFGAAVINGICHLVLKEAGVCTVRRLPHHYDLKFWKKYRGILNQLDANEVYAHADQRLKEAFVSFCAKDLKQAKNLLRDLLDKMHTAISSTEDVQMEWMDSNRKLTKNQQTPNKTNQESFAEMAVDLLLYFLDRQPSMQEDPRWAFSQEITLTTDDQKNYLRELAATKKFTLILRQLQVKLAFYKMFVLFLRTISLIEEIDYSLQAFQMRTGKAVIVELGEKLIAMIGTFRWFSEHSEQLPLLNRALSELSKQYMTRYGLPKNNPFLSPTDYVFNKVSTFHELVSVVVQVGEQTIQENSNDKARVINEIGYLLLTLVEGVRDAKSEEWVLHVTNDCSTWLNQPDFLTHFITHLNTALDYLAASTSDNADQSGCSNMRSTVIFEHCIRLADFVLSQQSSTQRNDSKIIARFNELGHLDIALELAERYKDFTFLVVYCHSLQDKRRHEEALNRYKQQYKDTFYDFLYTWYQQKGMYNHLLAEKGKRVSDFIAQHEQINWIRQIQDGQYSQAKKTLKRMANEELDEHKKLIELSLCKLTALCEDQENVAEIAELSEQIRTLQEQNAQGREGNEEQMNIFGSQ